MPHIVLRITRPLSHCAQLVRLYRVPGTVSAYKNLRRGSSLHGTTAIVIVVSRKAAFVSKGTFANVS